MNRDPFAAIADPTRRQLIALLSAGPQTVTGLSNQFQDISRIGVTKHLKYLEDCGLVAIVTNGRERHCYLQAVVLKEVQDWVSQYEQFWTVRLDKLGALLDEQNIEK